MALELYYTLNFIDNIGSTWCLAGSLYPAPLLNRASSPIKHVYGGLLDLLSASADLCVRRLQQWRLPQVHMGLLQHKELKSIGADAKGPGALYVKGKPSESGRETKQKRKSSQCE